VKTTPEPAPEPRGDRTDSATTDGRTRAATLVTTWL
jgi:hypothetical protein